MGRKRGSLQLKNSLANATSISTTRRQIFEPSKASSILLKRLPEHIDNSSETRKSNSLASFYKEEVKVGDLKLALRNIVPKLKRNLLTLRSIKPW